MAISPAGDMLGSVSGGCIEGQVIQAAQGILESGLPQMLSFGVANEDAWAVGLSCGGKVRVWVEPGPAQSPNPAGKQVWQKLEQALLQDLGGVWVSSLDPGKPTQSWVSADGSLSGDTIPADILSLAHKAYSQRKSQWLEHESGSFFLQVIPRQTSLLIIGATHITADLIALAKPFGFKSIVIDPRGVFGHQTHFETEPDHLHVQWPQAVLPQYALDAYTFAILLTHDPKIDDPALHLLLRSEVAYIGALGGRKTQAKRRERLQAAGFGPVDLERVHGPVGLDIGAQSAREIALSILGEVIQVKNAYQ